MSHARLAFLALVLCHKLSCLRAKPITQWAFMYYLNIWMKKVAVLQLKKLNAQLTTLTDQQAAYIGVSKQGPYKPDTYRY